MASSWRTQSLLTSLLLAVVAQFLMANNREAWTLLPGIMLYAFAIFIFVYSSSGHKKTYFPTGSLSLTAEIFLASGIGLVALFFRLYKIPDIPQGMTIEETCGPWLGFSSPPSQWVMFDPNHIAMAYLDIDFLSYLWFHIFAPSRLTYSFFFVFFSLISFPLAYWFFRDLAGPKTALLTLFLWSVMQWHVTLSRNGHPIVTTVFYVVAMLTFCRMGWRKGQIIYWVLSGFFAGVGFYAHPSFRACFLLLVVLLVFEYRFDKGKTRSHLKGIGIFVLVCLAVSWPCWKSMLHNHWLIGATYDDHLFVGQKMLEEKSLEPFWKNLYRAPLVLIRIGSPYTQDSLPGHPLLDHVTAVFFVLGFFAGIRRWKERKYFYGLAGLTVLCLPGLLSIDPTHASRVLCISPFVAYLAANAVFEFWERLSFSAGGRKFFMVLGVCLALFIVSENFMVYFIDRPRDMAVWLEADAAPMKIGQAIAREGDAYDYYLSPAFFGRFVVLFLGHSQQSHMHSLDLPGSFRFLSPSSGRGLFFILQEGRTGVLKVLQELYPEGVTEKLLDPWDQPYLYFFHVPPRACGLNRGLRGVPYGSYVDFPRNLPKKPFKIHLTGSYWVEQQGTYRYRIKDPAKVGPLDECPWSSTRLQYLARGFHPLDFTLSSQSGESVLIEESFEEQSYHPLDSSRFIPHRFSHGWMGTYRLSSAPDSTPLLVESEPILNFSHRDDFPLKNTVNLLAEWRGILHPGKAGFYHFLMLNTDHINAEMDINGKKTAVSNQEAGLLFGKKDYSVIIRLQQEGGFENAFHLLWKQPGQSNYEVLPPSVLK